MTIIAAITLSISIVACGTLGLMGGAAVAGGVLESFRADFEGVLYVHPGLLPATISGAAAGVVIGIFVFLYLNRKIRHRQHA